MIMIYNHLLFNKIVCRICKQKKKVKVTEFSTQLTTKIKRKKIMIFNYYLIG